MKKLSQERLVGDTKRVIENPFWIPGLETDVSYERIHDDHDGTKEGRIIIQIDKMGDIWFTTDKHHGSAMRFRTSVGGGMSERVRSALMILAYAIKLDNEERPQE